MIVAIGGNTMAQRVHALIGGIALAAISVAGGFSDAVAACTRSCSEVAATCVKMGASQAACSADLANCMHSGNLHMPSGRTFHGLCKK